MPLSGPATGFNQLGYYRSEAVHKTKSVWFKFQAVALGEERSENNIYSRQISHYILAVDVGFDSIPALLQFLPQWHEICPFLIHKWSLKVRCMFEKTP